MYACLRYHILCIHSFYRPNEKKTYLAVGSMKTLLLNVSLYNAGDDAYQTGLHIQLPKGLYFIKILDLVRIKILCPLTFLHYTECFFTVM